MPVPSEYDAQRLNEMWRWYRGQQGGGPAPGPARLSQRTADTQLVRVTSATPTDERYPGVILVYDSVAKTYSDGAACWVVVFGVPPLLSANYPARRVGDVSGVPTFHVSTRGIRVQDHPAAAEVVASVLQINVTTDNGLRVNDSGASSGIVGLDIVEADRTQHGIVTTGDQYWSGLKSADTLRSGEYHQPRDAGVGTAPFSIVPDASLGSIQVNISGGQSPQPIIKLNSNGVTPFIDLDLTASGFFSIDGNPGLTGSLGPGHEFYRGILVNAGSGSYGTGTGDGTVTSVGLSAPAEFDVSGSPVTESGTLSLAWASQAANLVFASPDGSAGVPAFRALSGDDLALTTLSLSGDLTVEGDLLVGTATEFSETARVQVRGSGTNNYRGLAFSNTAADATQKGAMALVGPRHTNSNAPFSVVGHWDFQTSRTVFLGGGGWSIPDATDIHLYTAPSYTETAGAGARRVLIGTGSAQINDTQNDYDFAVHGSGVASLIHVDAGNNRVGLGTASPAALVEAYRNDNTSSVPVMRIHQDHGSSTTLALDVQQDGTTGTYAVRVLHSSDNKTLTLCSGNTGFLLEMGSDSGQTALQVNTGGSNRFRIRGDGQIIVENLPTANPAIAGALWRSGNDMKVSTG